HPQYVLPKQQPKASKVASCPTNGSDGYTPAQLAKAYEFPTSVAHHATRLAMVELDGFIMNDISAFAKCFAPSVNASSVVNVHPVDTNKALPAGDGAIEVELDIEIALGLTPGLTQMDVYEAPNTGAGWLDLFAAIANDNVDGTVSVSWGSCEADSDSSTMAAEN